jgi:protein-tyrosine-phosphatase
VTEIQPRQNTVLFVCQHGAGKSRIAAALFNADAPPGWSATTAGIEPQEQVSAHAPRLLAETPAAAHLDETLPRPLSAITGAERIVAIDCAVDGAESWLLEQAVFELPMRDEIADRVETLIADLGR